MSREPLEEESKDSTTWGEAEEALLFAGLLEFKPAGVVRNFQIINLTKFINARKTDQFMGDGIDGNCKALVDLDRERPARGLDAKPPQFRPQQVWDHLSNFYDLAGVEENEGPNNWDDRYQDGKVIDFELAGEFEGMLEQKKKESEKGEDLLPPAVPVAVRPTPTASGTKGSRRKRQNSGETASNASRSSTPSGRKENRRS